MEDLTGYRLLVVDDNPDNLNMIMDYLSDSVLVVSLVRSGESCLEKALKILPDLILLDVQF